MRGEEERRKKGGRCGEWVYLRQGGRSTLRGQVRNEDGDGDGQMARWRRKGKEVKGAGRVRGILWIVDEEGMISTKEDASEMKDEGDVKKRRK